MLGWILWNSLARAGSAPLEKSCQVSYVMVTGLEGSLIDGLSVLRSSFCPSAPFCSVWATLWVDPPGPLSPDEPQPAATATASSAHTPALSTTFLIPSLLLSVPAIRRETRGLGASQCDGV